MVYFEELERENLKSKGRMISINGPQPFWHQGPVLWETDFPWTREWRMVLRFFKCVTFIVHFISIPITSAPSQIIRH